MDGQNKSTKAVRQEATIDMNSQNRNTHNESQTPTRKTQVQTDDAMRRPFTRHTATIPTRSMKFDSKLPTSTAYRLMCVTHILLTRSLERAAARHGGGAKRSERRRLSDASEAVVRRGISAVVWRAVQSAEISRVAAVVTAIQAAVAAIETAIVR
jgi:hypothetical protein